MAKMQRRNPAGQIDRDLVTKAVEGVTARIQKLILGIQENSSQTPVNETELQRLEDLLKKEVIERFKLDERAKYWLSEDEFKTYIEKYRQDAEAYAQRGVIGSSEEIAPDILIKILEPQEGILPHVIHQNNAKDYETMKDFDNFKIARIYEPFRNVKDAYLTFPDPSSSDEPVKKKSFVQFSERVPGLNSHNAAAVVFRSKIPEERKKEFAEKAAKKEVDDIFMWFKCTPNIIGEDGNNLPIDINEINQGYITKLTDKMFVHAEEYTECGLDENIRTELKQKRPVFERIFNELTSSEKIRKWYGKVLDSVPRNIIIKCDTSNIAKNIERLLSITDENFYHVDTRARYGHLAEDLWNIANSFAFRRYPVNVFDYAAEHGYSSTQEFTALLGMVRASRLRDYTLSEYTKRLFTTQKSRTRFAKKVRQHKEEISHFDSSGIGCNKNLIELMKNDQEAVSALSLLQEAWRQIANFERFNF